jgi:hypothetical protein
MTNNTERNAFEEWLKTVLSPIPEMGYEDEAKDLALLAWQAALAQREQEAPSLCTAEEAAELVKSLLPENSERIGERGFLITRDELANIINADRAKR